MFRTFHLCTQFFGLATAILAANCAVAINAVGQATPSDHTSECSAYASVPLPAEAETAHRSISSLACASYRSYRGIGRPVNYSEARACAWQERLAQRAELGQNEKEPTAWVVGGSLILADIYFNGVGVKRNIPLAMRFACEAEEGMATLALPDIAKLNNPPLIYRPFEFCDYAATTFTMNFCTSYRLQIEDDRRARYYASLKFSMTREQKIAFDRLLAAQTAYVYAHASEVDQGGTISSIRTLGSEDILNDLFHTQVVHFERKKWPELSNNQIVTADASLRHQYEKTFHQLRTRPKEESYEGAVTADHLSGVEESWKTYRDAWVAFARLRYPSAIATIRAEITLDRCRLLKTIS